MGPPAGGREYAPLTPRYTARQGALMRPPVGGREYAPLTRRHTARQPGPAGRGPGPRGGLG